MKFFNLSNILLVVSASCIIVALTLAGGSLSKSVKWSLYNSGTTYGVDGGQVFRLYAYQTLWTSYDTWKGKDDKINSQAYNIINDDSWRSLPRILVTSAIGVGAGSVAILLAFGLIPFFQQKTLILNISRISASMLATAAGVILSYALSYYKSQYRNLLAPVFYDPVSFYPDEDNVSTGFYMASTASSLLFISAAINVVNLVISFKSSKVNHNDIPVADQEEKAET